MIKLSNRGISASNGIAVGKLKFLKNSIDKLPSYTVQYTDSELRRYENAKKIALSELEELHEKAIADSGEDNAEIFSIHKVMLEDVDFNDEVKNNIEKHRKNAEKAVSDASKSFIGMLEATGDAYLMARATDVRDVSERVIRILLGKSTSVNFIDEECIIYTDDLTPSEALSLDKEKILAFMTAYGSSSSHTAILARTSGIPCIVGCGILPEEYDGKQAVIDGGTGGFEIEPTEDTLKHYRALMETEKKQKERLLSLKGLKSITKKGKEILLYANIGGKTDTKAVVDNDAEGIGLFRTEFIFIEKSSLPSEEEQFIIYSEIARKMNGKRVIIRTLDIGADKNAEYLKLPIEENPALGLRGIRLCLFKPEIFKTQIRAILRASEFGKIAIMIPMIASVFEIKEAKRLISEVKNELEREKISFDRSIEIGIMIETPAAAILSDKLASEVDFFSIGTNDLTQYTLAADRQNPAAAKYYRQDHEAVLWLIKRVCRNAHKAGIWVGVCGELASELSMTKKLLSLGVDELSVTPPMILPIREKIRNI